jgi:hypothetical protein
MDMVTTFIESEKRKNKKVSLEHKLEFLMGGICPWTSRLWDVSSSLERVELEIEL